MLYRDIFKVLGIYLSGFALLMLIPLILAYYYQFIADPTLHPQPHSTLYFLETILFCLALGAIFYGLGRHSRGILFKRECLILVVLIWFLTPALSSLPFLLSGTLTRPWQAYFEMASGLTTTGSTILHPKKYNPDTGEEVPIVRTVGEERKTHYSFYGTVAPVRDPETKAILYEGIEAVSKALLFWRSFMEWLGGGGIIVLFVALLSSLAVSGKTMFQLEVAGPVKDAFTPRVKQGALQLWLIYLALTILQTGLLLVTNSKMEWLDSITISLSSIATGGFSIRNANIGYYQNASTDWIVMLFMILGSINFTLYYFVIRGKFYRLYQPEILCYLGFLLAGSCLGAWYLVGEEKFLLTQEGPSGVFSVEEAIRYGFFQIISAHTTTGFMTANYDVWPYLVQALMIIVMFIGGMSGSTAGGIKIMRHLILFRIVLHKLESMFNPSKIRPLKVSGHFIDNAIASTTLVFFLILIFLSVLGVFLYIADNIDPETSFGLIACMVSNTGLSFNVAGPRDSCAFLSDFSLIVSSVLMILGRLEFFAVLALLVPAFWKQRA